MILLTKIDHEKYQRAIFFSFLLGINLTDWNVIFT